MIGRVGSGKRVDINFRAGQFFTHTRERAGPVAKEHCQLRSGFDLDRRLISHTHKVPLLDRADNQETSSSRAKPRDPDKVTFKLSPRNTSTLLGMTKDYS